jgi:hypothetical protein
VVRAVVLGARQGARGRARTTRRKEVGLFIEN